jgi:hypothetical protein
VVRSLGIPAEPSRAKHLLGVVEAKERFLGPDGIGCQPVLISAMTEEVFEWIGDGLRSRALAFPKGNGAVIWPRYSVAEALSPRQAAA